MVDALNKGGIETISSCCGHGRTDGYIYCKNYLLVVSKERNEIAVRDRYHKDWEDMAIKNDNISNPLVWKDDNDKN